MPPVSDCRTPILFLIVALAVGTLGACSSPRSDFYTLSSDTALELSGPAVPISIVVGPVTVPELVDRPQMVTRVSDNQVALNEFARWGESLKSNIPQAIAGNLVQLLGTGNVSVFPQGGEVGGYQVSVAILRFESVPGDSVTIDVSRKRLSAQAGSLSARRRGIGCRGRRYARPAKCIPCSHLGEKGRSKW